MSYMLETYVSDTEDQMTCVFCWSAPVACFRCDVRRSEELSAVMHPHWIIAHTKQNSVNAAVDHWWSGRRLWNGWFLAMLSDCWPALSQNLWACSLCVSISCITAWRIFGFSSQFCSFLADRTNGRAYATVLRPSVVCNVRIVAKRCVFTEKLSAKKQNRKWPMGNRMVTFCMQ